MKKVYVLTELQKVNNNVESVVIGAYDDLLDACNDMYDRSMQYDGIIKCTQRLQRAIKFEDGNDVVLLKVESCEIK